MDSKNKKYIIHWFSLFDGNVNYAEQVNTSNPKMALFNFACKMLITANSLFQGLPVETIIKNINEGSTDREHYWLEYPNGEVLSIMENLN